MKTPGAVQLFIWLIIGAAALAFLNWQNDDLDRDAALPVSFVPDSVTTPFRADSLRKPFARLKSPSLLSPRKLLPRPAPFRLKAEVGQSVPVSITAYCLQGHTKIGTAVHDGIVAADPRVFPLSSEIDVIVGNDTLGRFRVEDTGFMIKGRKLDIWLADCSEARAFGRKQGQATLAAKIRR